ncbi:hypothetical protein RUND412_007097 [Rhizina undulata]
MCDADIFLGILAILFPPIAVWVKRGICSADSLINLALCCLGYFPGLLHAWYIISKYPDPNDYAPLDSESQGYYQSHHHHHHPQQHSNYYTVPAPPCVPSPHPQQYPHPQNQFYGAHQQPQYYSYQSNASVGAGGSRAPERYSQGEQQTPPENVAGQAVEAGAPPSYASVVKGDHKIQHE